MRKRDHDTAQHAKSVLDALRLANAEREEATREYQAACIAWEDAVRRAYHAALPLSFVELAPTVAEMSDTLGISKKTFQIICHRDNGTAAWPRPSDQRVQPRPPAKEGNHATEEQAPETAPLPGEM